MVKCPNCGIEYDDNVEKCSFCGYRLKESPEENIKIEKTMQSGNKFNINSIFIGTLVYSGLMLFIIMLIVLFSLYYPLNLEALGITFIIPIIAGNILACWIGNSNYTQSMLNGGIIGILPVWVLLIFGYGNLDVLILFLVMGALGGVLGKFIVSKVIRNQKAEPMKKIRLSIIFLFVITAGILSTSMVIAGSTNMTYSNNGISFSYIGNLTTAENTGNTHPFGTGNNLTVIAALNGINNTGSQSDKLIISKGAAALSLQDQVNAEKASIQKANGTIISQTNLTVDGVPATEIDYNNTGTAGADLLIIKNNTLYDLNFNYDSNNELQKYTVFLMIENSFHVK